MPFKMRTPSVRMLNVTLESDRCTVKVGKTQNTVRPGVWSSHGQSRKNTKYSVVGPVRRFDSSKLSRPSASSHCKGARGAAPRPFRYEEKRRECATISVALCSAFFLLLTVRQSEVRVQQIFVALSRLSSSCGSEPTGGRGRAGARDNLLELKRQTGLFLRFSYFDHAMIRLLMWPG